jgi:hypothetical protein
MWLVLQNLDPGANNKSTQAERARPGEPVCPKTLTITSNPVRSLFSITIIIAFSRPKKRAEKNQVKPISRE